MYIYHKVPVMTLLSKSSHYLEKAYWPSFHLDFFPMYVRNIHWDLSEDLRVDYRSLNVIRYL